MTNYYVEFALTREMTLDEAQAQLSKERRKWTQRQNAPDLTKRQQAETKLALLDEAVVIFTDKWKREKYDKELDKSGNTATATQTQTYDIPTNAGTDALISIAQNYYDSGNNQMAIDVCNKAIANGVVNKEIFYILGMSFAELEKYKEAFAAFKSGIKAFPDVADFYVYAARDAALYLNNTQEATSLIAQAITVAPDNSFALATQVEILLCLGQADKAEAKVSQYVSEHPSDNVYKENVSEAYIRFSDTFLTYANNGAIYFDSEADLDSVLSYRKKAVDIFPCQRTNDVYNKILPYKEKKFNKNCTWGVIIGIGIGLLMFISGVTSIKTGGVGIMIVGLLLAVGGGFLAKLSIEPLWFTDKYNALGKRGIPETISWLLTQWIVWSWRISWKLISFALKLAFSFVK